MLAYSKEHIAILYFPIAHNALCLPPKLCINYCFGNMQLVNAKFGGQTKCVMGNWKMRILNNFSNILSPKFLACINVLLAYIFSELLTIISSNSARK